MGDKEEIMAIYMVILINAVLLPESEAPVVVCDCMAYIRSKGLYNEGVFRVNGNNDRIESIKVNLAQTKALSCRYSSAL